jgi:Mg2+ and Co2+ transporter CorA
MTHELTELAAVVGEEISLGQDLLENLAAQRQAILEWKISSLIERIEGRESLLSNLGAMEERRRAIVSRLGGTDDATLSLTEILCRVSQADQAGELQRLQADARRTYTRLQAEEKSLLNLMDNLLQHIRDALSPLSRPDMRLYGEQGTSDSFTHASSGLIQGKI